MRMQIRRMKKLLKVLETVRDEERKFDINRWVSGITDEDRKLRTLNRENVSCDTVACAAGWYCLMANESLKLKRVMFNFYPNISGDSASDSVENHFGLTLETYSHLFLPCGYHMMREVTVKDVISRVKRLLKKAGAK